MSRLVPPARTTSRPPRLVAIGASSGGPAAIAEIVRALPKDFAPTILIVQHMDPDFHLQFTRWLSTQSALPVRVATDDAPIEPGVVLIAPPGRDLVLQINGRIRLMLPPSGAAHAPSVDRLFHSVADAMGSDAEGILLTGMGEDGARGLRRLRERGAWTIAQDQASSSIWGMPGSAVSIGAAVQVLSLDQICKHLVTRNTNTWQDRALPDAPVHEGSQQMRSKIMIVDDSPVILEATKMALEDAGYEVVALDNPLLVATAVRRDRPDLVLIDVNMPTVTGDVVIQIINQYQSASRMKVVLYSDIPPSDLADRARKCGAHGFVSKTADEDHLLAQVRDLLGKAA